MTSLYELTRENKGVRKMKIELSDGYYITSDKYQYILAKQSVSEKGEEYSVQLKFHSSLKRLVECYRDQMFRENDAKTWTEFLDHLISTQNRLVSDLEKALGESTRR